MPYYSVYQGHKPGIYKTWDKCQKNITGYSNAIFKKFKDKDAAEYFLTNGKEQKIVTMNDFLIEKPSNKNSKKKNESTQSKIVVYTDGACSHNGSKKANAGFGVYFSDNDPRNLSKKVKGKQTNNVAELSAIIEVSNILKSELKNNVNVEIWTDSEYSIKCCTTYGVKQEKSGWIKDIKNKELVKKAYDIYKKYPNVHFNYIKAHTDKTDIHSIGNDNADKLANIAIGLTECPYQIQNQEEENQKIYLDVPFSLKDKAKALGALWDKEEKKWYIKNKKIDSDNFLFNEKDVKRINRFFEKMLV
jgi:ribonuclease HI